MSRNKIFIITGAIVSVILVALLILMQFIEGNAESIENSYTIEIQNCAPVANDNDLMNEFKAALQTTELKGQNGSFMSPLLKINNLKTFGAPIYGMNYVAFYFNAVMYVYSDRKKDTDLFFESYAKNNKAFQDLLKEAKKGTGKEIKLPAEFDKNPTEFIIAKGQNDPGKKIFSSLKDLRTHLDDLINKGKITKGTSVKVYFICRDLSSIEDKDKDGVMDDKDDCPEEKGDLPNGCLKKEKDKVKEKNGEPQKPLITTTPKLISAPKNVSITSISRRNGANAIDWNIANIDQNCKIRIDIIEKKSQQSFKSEELSYDVKTLNIPLSALIAKYPNKANFEVLVDIKVIHSGNIIAQKKSQEFTLSCKY
jgi:hypothetical protein